MSTGGFAPKLPCLGALHPRPQAPAAGGSAPRPSKQPSSPIADVWLGACLLYCRQAITSQANLTMWRMECAQRTLLATVLYNIYTSHYHAITFCKYMYADDVLLWLSLLNQSSTDDMETVKKYIGLWRFKFSIYTVVSSCSLITEKSFCKLPTKNLSGTLRANSIGNQPQYV